MDTEQETDCDSLRIDTCTTAGVAGTGKAEIVAGLSARTKDDQELKISKDLAETESCNKAPTDNDNPNLNNHTVMDSADTPSVEILESEDKDGSAIGQGSVTVSTEMEGGSTSEVVTEVEKESTETGSNNEGGGLSQAAVVTDDGTVTGEKDTQASESGIRCKMDYRSKEGGGAAGDSSDSSDSSSDSDESDNAAEKAGDKKAGDKEEQGSTSKQINKAFSARDESPETERRVKLNRYGFEDVRTKGELLPEELPPLEELTITVDETVEMKKVGTIKSIVGILVVIQTCENVPPLNDDTILFVEGHKVLGQVFEVFGPVQAPWYSVRFNKEENISNKELQVGMAVYCAPKEDTFTSYVFVNSLKQMKGSDASWEDNNEPPEKYVEYSDDESERVAKSRRKKKKHPAPNSEPSMDCLPQEGKRSRGNNNTNDQSSHGGGRPGQQPGSYRPRNPFQGSNSGPNRPRHPGPNNPRHAHNPRNPRWGPHQGNRPGTPSASFGGQPRFQPQIDQNPNFQFGQNSTQQGTNGARPSFQAGGGCGNPGQPFGGNSRQGTSQPFGGNDRAGLNQPFGNNTRPEVNQSFGNNFRPSMNQGMNQGMNQSFGSNVRPGVGQSFGGNVGAEANQNGTFNTQGRPPTPQNMSMNQSRPPWQNNMPFRTDIPPPTFNLSNNQTGCNNQNPAGPNSAPGRLPPNNNPGPQGNQNPFAGNMQSPAQTNSFNSYPQHSPASTQSFPQATQPGQFGNGPYPPPPPPQNNPPQAGGQNTNTMFQFGNNPAPQQPSPSNQFQNNFSGTNQNMFQGNANQMPANSNQRHPTPFQSTGNFSQSAPVHTGNRMKIHSLNPGLQTNTQPRPTGGRYETVQVGGSTIQPYRPEILQQQQNPANAAANSAQMNQGGPQQPRSGNNNMNNGPAWTG